MDEDIWRFWVSANKCKMLGASDRESMMMDELDETSTLE